MRTLMMAATAALFTIPVSAVAAPVMNVSFPSTDPMSIYNDLRTQLAGEGLTQYASTGASLSLSEAATITFYFMGSESGYDDTFTAGTLTRTETSSFEDHFGNPILIGSATYAAGTLAANAFRFTSSIGVAANIGDSGFAIFLPANSSSPSGYTTLYFGYDDEVNNTDDNHDDFLVKAVLSPAAVPEPATWAMMLSGFAMIGSLARSQSRRTIASFA